MDLFIHQAKHLLSTTIYKALINEEMIKRLSYANYLLYAKEARNFRSTDFHWGVSNYDLSLTNISWNIILARSQNIKRSKAKK